MEEIWKEVDCFEGLYQVSNMGRVKSLNYKRSGKERILKPRIGSRGYFFVCLSKDKKRFEKTVHTIVWDAFGDEKRDGRILQVDHINNIKTDNRIENLQLLSNRENCSKKMYENKSSIYKGVCWHKNLNKWQARIWINKKRKHLGCFISEKAASDAYQKALKNHLF